MRNKENIVKKACRVLGWTQKELSEKIKSSKSSVDRWATGEVPEDKEFLLSILIENEKLKKENFAIKTAWNTLNHYASKEGVSIPHTL